MISPVEARVCCQRLRRYRGFTTLVYHTGRVPSVLVNDTAPSFQTRRLKKLATLFGVDSRFAVANSPSTNATVGCVMKEILRVLKAILVEYRSTVTHWEHFVPMVQWALNSSYLARLGCSS